MYEVFEQLLQKFGVTAYKVSKEAGVSQSMLSEWKKGSYVPKQDKLQKIADYFGVSIEYLMTGKEPKIQPNELMAKSNTERKVLMLCRKAENASEEDKEMILKQFEATIDMYLHAKGIKSKED